MSQYHLGVNLGHDRSAAIVRDGEIIAAIHQERLDRRKNSIGLFLQAIDDPSQIQLPDEAIQYCLKSCGIGLLDVGSITANMPGIDHSANILRRNLPSELGSRVLEISSHHLAHAYTAYWPSGFEKALILVVDATGSTTPDHLTESYTVYRAEGTNLSVIHSEKVAAHTAWLSTLGSIYEYVARKAGFVTKIGPSITVPEAGKLMGLAPYGGNQAHWQRWISMRENNYSLDISAYDIFLEIAALEKQYGTGSGKPYLQPYLIDLAWKVQKELEEALLHIVGLAVCETGIRKVCLAGGVALNSVANYKILRGLNLEDIFIFPAAGDGGIAAGCALWAYATQERPPKTAKSLRTASLGCQYSLEQIECVIDAFNDRINVQRLTSDQVVEKTAKSLSRGHIIARFEGGSEYGSRALGNRSILADPSFAHMKDVVNARVKFRESFRPFAPVIPEEDLSIVFKQNAPSPFMLLVSEIKSEYQAQMPAITHYDGTGRVQTVTRENNPYFYNVCRTLSALRSGPPILLNTSFNVAGQPIVETPEEAIETFLSTDIDYLCLEDYWISKIDFSVRTYKQHLEKVPESVLPQGLPPNQPPVTHLMRNLDRALFFGETEGCQWTIEELQKLSSEGGKYKETSLLFQESPFGQSFRSQLSRDVLLLIDPLGDSSLIDLTGRIKTFALKLKDVCDFLAVFDGTSAQLEDLRISKQLTTREWQKRLYEVANQLRRYPLESGWQNIHTEIQDSILAQNEGLIFAQFHDPQFSVWKALESVRKVFDQAGYTESAICNALKVESLQLIEPSRLHYYDSFVLSHDPLDDLTRLFLLRVSLGELRIKNLFGESNFNVLKQLGVLIPRGDAWASRVDMYCADGLYIATDHRYMILEEDLINEDPVMYLGLDSMGLVHTAPRYPANRLLDLCTGSGLQALVGSRYTHCVIGVDINPRAVRFARFNAQLNGIRNVDFIRGDLYKGVQGQVFDVILANPPFVPSPKTDLCFRDGGEGGEIILHRIIREAPNHLTLKGKLHIVTDLVDVRSYQTKLEEWWGGGASHMLVLQTADRDEILFSVPHSKAPFGQSFGAYNDELGRWVNNFREAGITSINFGYILIHRLSRDSNGSYYSRIIFNPTAPIYGQVCKYFEQREYAMLSKCEFFFLKLNPDIRFRMEFDHRNEESNWELFSPDNPFYTTYMVNGTIFHDLLRIAHMPAAHLGAFLTSENKDWIMDFIYKGILRLSVSPQRQHRHHRWVDGSVYAGDQGMAPLVAATQSDGASVIRELETKTTPTCLSSYIGQ